MVLFFVVEYYLEQIFGDIIDVDEFVFEGYSLYFKDQVGVG